MMRLRYYSTEYARRVHPGSRVKIYRKAKGNCGQNCEGPATSSSNSRGNGDNYYENSVKVQMISENLHRQIFPQNPRDKKKHFPVAKCIGELKRHGLDISSTEPMPDVHLKLPPLAGSNIEEHFSEIGRRQAEPYLKPLRELIAAKLPPMPSKWSMEPGWSAYDPITGARRPIDYPTEEALTFDVEVCMREGAAPTLATAAGSKSWYSWVSPVLAGAGDRPDKTAYKPSDLVPFGKSGGPKIIVGHNVSYDRARIREQYYLDDNGMRFLDTMSLHVCVSGVTSYQRAMLKSKRIEPTPDNAHLTANSSLNGLADVYRLYCGAGGKTLLKDKRNVFVEGSLQKVLGDFQSLMRYCAGDVAATHDVLCALFPMFSERFPHPVTFAGMLEIGSAYLPVNNNWRRYIKESNLAFEDLSIEASYHLQRRADEACALLNDGKYKSHLWLWDENWSVQALTVKKSARLKKNGAAKTTETASQPSPQPKDEEDRLKRKFQGIYEQAGLLPARPPVLPGYPQWYRKLCEKSPREIILPSDSSWMPGPFKLSTGMKIAPKLLALCWEGYPLHHLRAHGWGFLVPFRDEITADSRSSAATVPIAELAARCPVPEFARKYASEEASAYALEMLPTQLDVQLSKREFFTKELKEQSQGHYKGSGVWCNQTLDDCVFFIKLPHKNGRSFRVGNPLSKDFLQKFSEKVLTSGDDGSSTVERVISIARMVSYWRNNRDRIMGQLVVYLPHDELPTELRPNLEEQQVIGAICPQVVSCGTLTRRAMESTWMTASNSRPDRLGSELRAMIQAPPGYRIVGADVDSQELWIASVLGDAHDYQEHGASPLGWMTLSGTKANGTDMHSITAKVVGISRDHAKVINYARIYGAGQTFAEVLLRQFNPSLSQTDARTQATKMFNMTKGKRFYRLRKEFHNGDNNRSYNVFEARKLAAAHKKSLTEVFHRPTWHGGSESAMFNRLEEIAVGMQPVTPFLGCRLSRALEANGSGDENRYLPTRVNWVVQSGAVDFLHLMLVCMRWLMGPHMRFCLSFHDELRYLVKEEYSYKAALALHVTNLLTRSFCASRIGLSDLPMSVAFFSSVEVDTVLRKESSLDCKTPSNPHGLRIGYGIPEGESLNIQSAIEKAGGNDLSKWPWIEKFSESET